jgi:AraC-like DNA-binding protein
VNVSDFAPAFPAKLATCRQKNPVQPSGQKLKTLGKEFYPSTTAQFWSIAARQAGYNLRKLSRNTGIHIRQLERFCRRELGRAPEEWLSEQRIIAARSLLLETDSIKKVAMELGFKQLSHFCRQFKKVYGMTPSEFLLAQDRRNQFAALR